MVLNNKPKVFQDWYRFLLAFKGTGGRCGFGRRFIQGRREWHLLWFEILDLGATESLGSNKWPILHTFLHIHHWCLTPQIFWAPVAMFEMQKNLFSLHGNQSTLNFHWSTWYSVKISFVLWIWNLDVSNLSVFGPDFSMEFRCPGDIVSPRWHHVSRFYFTSRHVFNSVLNLAHLRIAIKSAPVNLRFPHPFFPSPTSTLSNLHL